METTVLLARFVCSSGVLETTLCSGTGASNFFLRSRGVATFSALGDEQ